MSILKFLHETIGGTKGRYYRYVGRHTRKFCARGARRAKNQDQKWIWLSSAISADEVIATLAGLERRRPIGVLADWQLRPDVEGESYVKALRTYLSGLLLLYGSCKGELLKRLELTEQDFMETWQSVYEYDAKDKAIFDDNLLPAFRNRGIDGLVVTVGELIRDGLFLPESRLGEEARTCLQDLMINDLAALKRHLEKEKEGSVEGERK